MHYIVNANNYIVTVTFGGDVECDWGGCTEYTGSVPTGYTSLEDWYADEAEKLYRWKIVNGKLTLDSGATPPEKDIGFAPGGYIETATTCADEDELDTVLVTLLAGMRDDSIKFFRIRPEDSSLFRGSRVIGKIFRISEGCGAVTFEAYDEDGLMRWSKSIYDNVCNPLEWENPPLTTGVEYRTNQRHIGNVVYQKYVSFGAGPNATTKSVAHECSNVKNIIEWHIINANSGTNVEQATNVTAVTVSTSKISITTSANESAWSLRVLLKYTKTTG